MRKLRHKATKTIQRTKGPPRTLHSALRTPHSAAFTLLELMLVVAILCIALAFSWPAIREARHRAPMTQAVKDISDACRNARSKAILSGQPMELRIYPRDMRIEVGQAPVDAPPSTPDATSSSSSPTPSDGAPTPTFREPPSPYISSAQLSDEIRLEMVDVNFTDYTEADIARVRFYPNGTCDQLTMVLRSDVDFRKISLEVVTSLVRIDTDPQTFNQDD